MSEQEQVKPDPFGEDMRYGVGLTLSEAEWLKGELELLAHETPQCHGIVNSIMPGINWAIETGRRDKERMVRRRPSVEDELSRLRDAARDFLDEWDEFQRAGCLDGRVRGRDMAEKALRVVLYGKDGAR